MEIKWEAQFSLSEEKTSISETLELSHLLWSMEYKMNKQIPTTSKC